jgi:hypothetical protein
VAEVLGDQAGITGRLAQPRRGGVTQRVRAGKIEDEDGLEDGSLRYQRMMHEIYAVQRQALVQLRDGGQISSAAMRTVERELDLEESRLEV